MLAIQGDFEAHARVLRRLSVDAIEVRRAQQLSQIDGLIIPGGESTTITKGLVGHGLVDPVAEFIRSGKPTFGTCAGLIVLGRDHLGLMDLVVERNAYGRQIHSFEAQLSVEGIGAEPFIAVFIRAPRIAEHGPEVEVLAELEGDVVVARERNMLVASFHPELTDDARLHALFCAMVGEQSSVGAPT